MKRLIIFLMILMMTRVSVYAGGTWYTEYTKPEISYNIQYAGVKINYINKSSNDAVFCNGRLGVPLAAGVKALGGELKSSGAGYTIKIGDKRIFLNSAVTSNKPVIFTVNNDIYVSLYELITPFGYVMTVNLENNSVNIVKGVYDGEKGALPALGSKEAYIRFEDITADGLKPDGTGKYTVDMLEKLRYTAEYLYNRGQEYYVAWVPVYTYPAGGYTNDVSRNYSLYNSYFLYVMDYMADHNGHIGLHGYTHQYGNEESTVGYEFGSSTPYNRNEQMRRMIAAKDCCSKLGYTDEFFEFPHYGATSDQLLMAEYYFDAIYQSYPNGEYSNCLTYINKYGKNIYYIPTPADYIHYKGEHLIFEKMKSTAKSGYTLSLFFHPIIDEDEIFVESVNGERVWRYSENAMLPQIVDYAAELGYSFADFK